MTQNLYVEIAKKARAITGHAKLQTSASYQHLALDAQLEERCQKAMREVEI